jgi:hypothetical protein
MHLGRNVNKLTMIPAFQVEVFIFWGKKASQLVACKVHMCQLQKVKNKNKNSALDMHLEIEHETWIFQYTSALKHFELLLW